MDTKDALCFYEMLRHEKQTEMRAINPETKEIRSTHFSSKEEFIKLLNELEGRYNIYLGVNERKLFGTKKEDVLKVKVIPIDIDCINKPANDEDISLANNIATQIIQDTQTQGFKKPFVAYSGNGYQLFFAIPSIELTEENREEVEEKIQEFQKRLIERYSNERIRLDNVGDLPRIMRVPGTFNLKSKTTSKVFLCEFEEDIKLKEMILNIKPTKSIIIGGLSEELKEKIKHDEIIQKYMAGDLNGRTSRSEAEMSLVCRLVQLGLDKNQIFFIMANCKLGKWQEANVQYRELTYKKAIEIITEERVKQNPNPILQDLYLVYRKWLYLEDTKRIDIVLAAYLSRFLEGTPIWLLLVGNSGDGKTEQVMALKNMEGFRILHNLTARALCSGMKDVPDLAPELNGKLVVIPDMAQILQLPPQEKGELWGQLRDLYDGFAGKDTGSGKRTKYENLRITLIGCSTPKIDGQILVHQDLGTREVIYRTEDVIDEFQLMDYAMRNEEQEKQMKKELSEITTNFLKDKKPIPRELTLWEEEELKNIALFIAQARATAEYDSYVNELRNYVYPERPTRIIKQLKRLYICLMSLENNYSQERAFQILWHLGKSCAFPIRISIFEYFIRDFLNKSVCFQYSLSRVANDLRIGKRTAQRELQVLWNMGILMREERDEGHRWQMTEYWKLNITNRFIESYLKFIKQGEKIVANFSSGV